MLSQSVCRSALERDSVEHCVLQACAKERAKLEASCKEAEAVLSCLHVEHTIRMSEWLQASVTQHQQEISLLQRRIAAADT